MTNPTHQKTQHSTIRKPTFKTTLRLSIFLGLFGGDRFYLGDTWLGIFKLLFTFPILGGIPNGLLISVPWWLADIFIINRHRHDWSKWLSSRHKRAKARQRLKKLAKEQATQQEIEAKEKVKKGICPACGEKRLRTHIDHTIANQFGKGLYRKCYNCGWETVE